MLTVLQLKASCYPAVLLSLLQQAGAQAAPLCWCLPSLLQLTSALCEALLFLLQLEGVRLPICAGVRLSAGAAHKHTARPAVLVSGVSAAADRHLFSPVCRYLLSAMTAPVFRVCRAGCPWEMSGLWVCTAAPCWGWPTRGT